jgi:pimeloyl-ACP methyl ester carboxylesterase
VPDTVASADGTPIAVWRSGSGPSLVLVHGAMADHTRWAPVMPALEEHFTVLAMDRRGRGASGDADDYALEREVEDVVAVVESAGDEVNLLGHSHGGGCALEAALRAEGLRRLVLYEPPLGFLGGSPEVVERLETLLAEGKRDEVLSLFLTEVARQPPEAIELMRSLPSWDARLATAHTLPREERVTRGYRWEPDRFRELDVPTLFLLGGDSPEPFRLAGKAVAEALPDCEVVELPGQRHAAMDTATELFVRELLAFLDGA